MKIIIDIRTSQDLNEKYHGGLIYSQELIKLISTFIQNKNINIKIFIACDNKSNNYFKNLKNVVFVNNLSCNNSFINFCKQEKIDIFISPLPFNIGLFKKKLISLYSMKKIVVIHGLRQLECIIDKYEFKYFLNNYTFKSIKRLFIKKIFPKFYKKRRFNSYKKIIDPNFKIIAVSNHTKFSIISYYQKIIASNIFVSHSPIREQSIFKENEVNEVLKFYSIKKNNFFLSVSMGRWYKNPIRLLEAIEIIDSKISKNYKFVFTGISKKFKKKIQKKFKKINNRLILLSFIDFKNLDILYFSAFSFIYPSLNEGFGYPPLEAMKFGLPILASSISSIPEVCDNAALYFNPLDSYEIANRIIQIIERQDLYYLLKEKGLERYNYFKHYYQKFNPKLIKWILN